jgi:hypothetical protein
MGINKQPKSDLNRRKLKVLFFFVITFAEDFAVPGEFAMP